MNGKNKADDHQKKAAEYLRNSENTFIRRRGIYQPAADEDANQIKVEIKAEFPQERRLERPRANSAEIFSSWAMWVAAFVGIFTLCGLAAAAYIAIGQWGQMIIANENAAHSLEETRKSNTSSAASFAASQRAYMTAATAFQFLMQASNPNEIDEMMTYPVWTNSGTTPTRELFLHTNWVDSAIPDKFDFPDKWDAGAPHKNIHIVLGPKATATGTITHIKLAQMRAIADGASIPITLYGWARYRDIFPGTKVHLTEYCWHIEVHRISGGPAQGRETFSPAGPPCAQYNCADDECKDYKEKLRMVLK